MNGKGYLTQGVDYDVNSSLNDFWEYDPATDSWTELSAPDPSANLLGGLGFVFNGKAYIGLGINESADPVSNIWQYDPEMDDWKVHTTFPGVLRRSGQAFVAGDNAYIINGDSAVNNRPFADTWRFKPESQ
jgi:N-acetylneuraminic acid mutarotase